MEKEIRTLLLSLGVMPSWLGFGYLVDAIQIFRKNRAVSMTKELYPQVAEKHGTTGVRVERAMRHAIASLGDHVSFDEVCEILGTQPSIETGRFKNGEFISLCAMKIEDAS